ncbi:rotatin-like [Plodia interpunctella]|uniref:rotatin-like n=1 Tax=Plodia interpunctella TaxID=58824 RepID=UPI0023680788|nr:rotatin-like [Plodia interpunctella]
MATTEILSSYIEKLNHPLKEIRERALKLLIAKLQLGWQFEDELSGTRQLLEALLAWFHVLKPSLQKEVLQLLLTTLKTKAGSYISKEFGIKKILSSLDRVKEKIDPDAVDYYEDVLDTLRFLNSVQSDVNVAIPPLTIPSVTGSESDETSGNGFSTLGSNYQSSKESFVANDEVEIIKENMSQEMNGIKVLLFPWVDLCSSDFKTMLLVEDALRLLKSTRRCCRFIRDVFLRDFPAEIFLNRPLIIKSLLAISEGGNAGRPGEALQVLLHITRALCQRLKQLCSIDLIHEAKRVSIEPRESEDSVNMALEHIASDGGLLDQPREDGLAVLRQLPAPIYALDTLQSVLGTMQRSVICVDPADKTEFLNMKELTICINLVEHLVQLLLDCVSDEFWSSDHTTKTHRDISHKSCMVMRLLGDLLMKYNKSSTEDSESSSHSTAWLRLVRPATRLLRWAATSALPPAALLAALRAAQLDYRLRLLYPECALEINTVLQNARSSVDQEHNRKYSELSKLFSSMDDAVYFMRNKNNCRNSKAVLTYIQKSLPVLEVHLSENYVNDASDILLYKLKDLGPTDKDWSVARSVALNLMAHNVEWVRAKFYSKMADMVKSVLMGDENNDNEKCFTLLCDVGILTEICCHGLSSKSKQIAESSSEIMIYLLRGRLVLSEGCWWRLLASLLPVLPLLHVYAAHDTPLGVAIWKSLQADIAARMGVPETELVWGLVRLLLGLCVAVQLEAAHSLCRLIEDDRYLPPKESLRADILMNAIRRIEPQDFNIDFTSSPSKTTQTTGLLQMLDVLKQDIILNEDGDELMVQDSVPALEPSLRRSTLQQLAVMMRQLEFHDTFQENDGVQLIVTILRMSLMVDDYLAYPECAISCVSILNSVCFATRHELVKIPDLPKLLLRVILVFPANEAAVVLSAQALALVAWSGFALLELDARRRRTPALPLSVVRRVALPFRCNTYWHTSPNAEHSTVEWLVSNEECRAAVLVGWWSAWRGTQAAVRGAESPPAPLALRVARRHAAALAAACPVAAAADSLRRLENATTHAQVIEALCVLESYVYLLPSSSAKPPEFAALPWQHLRRFLAAPPASARDTSLLIALMQFMLSYMDNLPNDGVTMSWIKSYFIGNDSIVISLLSRDQLHPHQTSQDNIEVTQLHIHIVKIVLRCIIALENDDYDTNKMESLLKILITCLERVDLKNFHMLGYLNELMRCIRYGLNSRYCKLSEDTLLQCLSLTTRTLSGCAAGGGLKGQACRLDAVLALLAMMRQIQEEMLPVQRWSECWSSDAVRTVVNCVRGLNPQLRAAALLLIAMLAGHAQLMPHLLQAITEESLSQFASVVFTQRLEANVVRSGAARVLAAVCARASPHSDVLELDVLGQLLENNFIENCLEILIDFCNEKEYKTIIEPNVPLAVLERRSELEVRAQKSADTRVSPSMMTFRSRPPPTAELVASLADVLHNVSAFGKTPVQTWNDQGLYRLLFRCASWSSDDPSQTNRVRAACCRALVAFAAHKCVRALLAATKDCLYSLVATLVPLEHDECDELHLSARVQALLLLASLLVERTAADTVWTELKDRLALPFFGLVLQSLESDENEFQLAGMYCLSLLVVSTTHKKYPDKTKDNSCVEFYDNLKSPLTSGPLSSRGAGDGSIDCQPEYMAEEICKAILSLYQKSGLDMKRYQCSQDDNWVRVCSCLCSILSVSPRSRRYSCHRHLPQCTLATLQCVRDHLGVQGKPHDVIPSANNNPVLRTLYWLLTVIDCAMTSCQQAKEAFAEQNLCLSLNRLWPWCMLTEQLRVAAVHLLYTFSNGCPKAWSSMCSCVSGRNLVGEVSALVVREAALLSRARSDTTLLLCVHTLRRTSAHQQCRAIILKSDVLPCLYKLAVRSRSRPGGCGGVGGAWARLCETLSRHAEGAGALLSLQPQLAALPPALRPRLLPAIAHAALHQRLAFLQSSELLELLSGTLLAGDTAEMVSAGRAVWSLAANNHKAKLQLRSAGMCTAVYSAMQRLRRLNKEPAAQRALQLLTYTNTVLQAT